MVFFAEQRDFDDPARRFDQRRMIANFGDPSGQKHVGGRRQDTHTADKVRTHGQTLLFYRYRFFFWGGGGGILEHTDGLYPSTSCIMLVLCMGHVLLWYL